MNETTEANWWDDFAPASIYTPRTNTEASKPQSFEDHGLPFADAPEVEEKAPVVVSKPREEVEAPKPQPEAPKAVEKASEPVEATPEGPFGLKERREWLNKVSKAFKGQHRIFHVAAEYALRANGKDRTVYTGSEALAEATGIAERHLRTERARLVEKGFLLDTGERKGRATVYRLT